MPGWCVGLRRRRVLTWSIRWARLLPTVSHTVLLGRDEDRDVVLETVDREAGLAYQWLNAVGRQPCGPAGS